MKPHYTDDSVTLYHGDALDVLRELPDESVHAVVTDPPYGLANTTPEQVADTLVRWVNGDRNYLPGGAGFMGKAWDAFVPPVAVWDECLRVLKPGGHVLAFAGSRTHDLMTMAIRLAGFDVRDSIAWLYASGFPKSLDVSKAIDKAAGAERAVIGSIRTRDLSRHGGEIRGDMLVGVSRGSADVAITTPTTPDAVRWQGWGTALKPAFEPIVVARKPLAGTVAANVLEHGTGALNIDACRVGDELRQTTRSNGVVVSENASMAGPNYGRVPGPTVIGRWPANVVLDDTQAAELDRQGGVTTSRIGKPRGAASGDGWGMTATGAEYDDTGGASRFFPIFRYEPKAPTSERPRVKRGEATAGHPHSLGYNQRRCAGCDAPQIPGDCSCPDGPQWVAASSDVIAHPTVKPIDLMRWLVRLVTPPGGTVLEPFAGSGTTAEACVLEGFQCIAVEREADYLPLITARLTKPLQVGLDLGGIA